MAASTPSHQPASRTFELLAKSVEETQRFGERLGALLKPGDVVAMIGELGSGKTTLIQGLAKGLGIDPAKVKSPTFIVLREYAGRVGLIHIDGYRVEDASSVVWLDLEWVFSPSKVTVIEWADRLAGCLPEERFELRLAHKTTNQRAITVIPHGSRATQLIDSLHTATA